MANCPYCAEQYGLRQIFGKANCGACGLPVITDEKGRIESYASKNAVQILRQPAGAGYWLWLGIGALATLILSIIPTMGIVTSLVLPFIQVFCLERSVQRYQEHFGFLHALTIDFYSSFLFLVMVIAQSAANAFLVGPPSALISVPLFLLVWWIYGSYSRGHFRRVANHQPPSPIELVLIGLIFGSVLLVPAAIFVAVLISYFSA